MKNQNGMTLYSVIFYIILVLIALITLGTLMAHFSTNVKEVTTTSRYDTEFNKINVYLIDELQRTDNTVELSVPDSLDAPEQDYTFITFNNGDTIWLNKNNENNKKVYFNNVLISENIESFKINYKIDNPNVIEVYLRVGDTEQTTEYLTQNSDT